LRKAVFLGYTNIFKEKLDKDDLKNPSKFILNLYDSILAQSECYSEQRVKYYRYKFLSYLVYRYKKNLSKELTSTYKLRKKELNPTGLKPHRDGFGLGIHSIHGKENWIGLDFSFVSLFQGVSYLKYECENQTKYFKPSNIVVHSTNSFVFSYSQSSKSKTNDFSFSLFELNAPLTFIPMRFGVQTNPESNNRNFYYRPGFGLSVGMISMSYSYNLMFSKSIRPSSEKHLLYFRLIYPIINFRYRTKRY